VFNDYVIMTKIMKEIRIDSKILSSLEDYFKDFSKERGCALGIKDNVISSFFPIKNLSNEKRSFVPSFDDLNKAAEEFNSSGHEFIGIMHSHLSYSSGNSSLKPSDSDEEFYRNFQMKNPSFKFLLFPIIGLQNCKKVIKWYTFSNNKLEEIDVK